jgi:hypothetical protein
MFFSIYFSILPYDKKIHKGKPLQPSLWQKVFRQKTKKREVKMKQNIEKTKKMLWSVEQPEKKIVIKISDIKNSIKRRRRLKNDKTHV